VLPCNIDRVQVVGTRGIDANDFSACRPFESRADTPDGDVGWVTAPFGMEKDLFRSLPASRFSAEIGVEV